MKGQSNTKIEKYIVSPVLSISDAIDKMDHAGAGVLLVCEADKRLLGIITDGDIRRSLLKSIPHSNPCISIATKNYISAHLCVSETEALHLMNNSKPFIINHLPVLDSKGKVVDLLLRRDIFTDRQIPVEAMIMAGGFGKRLQPLTKKMPKPMLTIGDKPVLEHIINRLQKSGIKSVKISTHYLSEKISEYFSDGSNFDVEIEYVNETNPLGTAGSIGLIERPQFPILIINGDILTDIDFSKIYEYHKKHKADLTIAVRPYEFQVPYGVVEQNGPKVYAIQEKPSHSFFVNAGIYLIQPSVQTLIPKEKKYHMTELIKDLIEKERTVVSYPLTGYWLDIGRQSDYEKAKKDYDTRGNII